MRVSMNIFFFLVFLCPAASLAQETSQPGNSDSQQRTLTVWLSGELAPDPAEENRDDERWVITDVRFDGCLIKTSSGDFDANNCRLNPKDREDSQPARRYRHDVEGKFQQEGGPWEGSWYELEASTKFFSHDIRLKVQRIGANGKIVGKPECRTGIFLLCQSGKQRIEQGEPLEIFLNAALMKPGTKALVFKGIVGSLGGGGFRNVDDVKTICEEESAKVWYAVKFYWPSVRDSCGNTTKAKAGGS